ncbi:MAG: biotin--[acetyl-CoA-carboxylase] ligase [Deltaproteobacteria bacterium]
MQDRIIDFLRKKQGYISGEEISNNLNISRQALWKHIQELKESGYEITAVPHLGYRLISSPDRLYPSEITRKLHTKFIGKKVSYFEAASSTMDLAWQMAMKGASEGTLIVAETQSKGRGRLGRTWSSPKYKGIYISLILRPKISPDQASILTLLSAVSICEAVKEITGLETKIKWPNDLLLGNKKLGGILTELNAEMDEVRYVVIGIGLNVNNGKASLISSATSLKEHKGESVGRIELLQEILRRIEANYCVFQEKGNQDIIEKWRNYSVTLGKRIRVVCQKHSLEGHAVDIDSDGGLLLRQDSGLTQKIMSGDVVHCR